MKKVKIMLTAITVFAVVGGALAFKAKKYGDGGLYTKTANANCDSYSAFITTTTDFAIPEVQTAATQSGPCETLRVIAAPL